MSKIDINTMLGSAELQREFDLTHEQLAASPRQFSDIVDGDGNQYVNLVMSGGGMLGIALVGYSWALEQFGIRFLGVGGTSAGAINALLLAGLARPAEKKSARMLEELANLDFFQFVDGGANSEALVQAFARKSGKINLAFRFLSVLRKGIVDKLGMNPGDAFTNWLNVILEEAGVVTLADLEARMADVPASLHVRSQAHAFDGGLPSGSLALIAADVTNQTRVEFPKMAGAFYPDPQSVRPGLFGRASMSIPYFFEPVIFEDRPVEQGAFDSAWHDTQELADTRRSVLVDGGIMSNFPIDVFHHQRNSHLLPTLGVTLDGNAAARCTEGPLQLLSAMFNSARRSLDGEFLRRNPEYRNTIQKIPCQGFHWLNFAMQDEEKVALFQRGAVSAMQFLRRFDWQEHKALRYRAATSRHYVQAYSGGVFPVSTRPDAALCF